MTKTLTSLLLGLGIAASLTACSHREPPSSAPAPTMSTVAPSLHGDVSGAAPAGTAPAGTAPAGASPRTPTAPATGAGPAPGAAALLDQLGAQASQAAGSVGADLAAASPGAEPDPTS